MYYLYIYIKCYLKNISRQKKPLKFLYTVTYLYNYFTKKSIQNLISINKKIIDKLKILDIQTSISCF